MTVSNDLRKTAKSLNIKITQDGKYKTIKQLKTEIDKLTLNGGSVKSNFIKNIIYKKEFDPSMVNNPSKDILKMKQKPNSSIQFLKQLQTIIEKDNNELKLLTKYKDKKKLRSVIIGNIILYSNKFKEFKKYYDINQNTLLEKDAKILINFINNKTNNDFVNNILYN